MVVFICNPSTQEAEVLEFKTKLGYSGRPSLKKRKEGGRATGLAQRTQGPEFNQRRRERELFRRKDKPNNHPENI
jgi:hypothetical protein